MDSLLEEFLTPLLRTDKEKCVLMALGWLEKKAVTIRGLYDDIIKAALMRAVCSVYDSVPSCIWQEHARTAIARTIVECAYPYVLRERDSTEISCNSSKSDLRVVEPGIPRTRLVVVCPEGELHELGPRIAADYFTLAGFEVYFIGSNTPREDFLTTLPILKPDYIAVSVTTHYNLVEAKKLITRIREKDPNARIVGGGQAIAENSDAARAMGITRVVNTYDDIMAFGKEVSSR